MLISEYGYQARKKILNTADCSYARRELSGKTVLDLGCGSGFFTRSLGITADKVIGLDKSSEQIRFAKQRTKSNIEYILSDIMLDELPSSHIVIAPFVLGYCIHIDILRHLCTNIYNSIDSGGRFVGVIDLPSGENLKKFGATKILHKKDSRSEVEIILSDGSSPICTLWATYFSPETITSLLTEIGFKIQWHQPFISEDDLREMPRGFWDGYIDNSELGYFTATKNNSVIDKRN